MSDLLSDYRFSYPESLVALHPESKREASRLFVLDKNSSFYEHRYFKDISAYFENGDVLVINDTKVFPCRLLTQSPHGGRREIFLIEKIGDEKKILGKYFSEWKALVSPSGKIPEGTTFLMDNAEISVGAEENNLRKIKIISSQPVHEFLERSAHVPLPPYIKRHDVDEDKSRYQTVFAEHMGSVAAPTAGLHMTPEILETLKNHGVTIIRVTLHVGLGTFLPVKTNDVRQHVMHSENYFISEDAAQALNQARAKKQRVTALGTTSARVLETLARNHSEIHPGSGSTNIFIKPPDTFRFVNRLITNFHQPESTLLILVSAFAGREKILSAYGEAIRLQYRLFSYGDAMLIF